MQPNVIPIESFYRFEQLAQYRHQLHSHASVTLTFLSVHATVGRQQKKAGSPSLNVPVLFTSMLKSEVYGRVFAAHMVNVAPGKRGPFSHGRDPW